MEFCITRAIKTSCRYFLRAVVVVLLLARGAQGAPADRGAVATVHPLATRAGMDVLKRGGNAVDAAIAAAVMLNVVDSHNSGLGGGCFILARLEDGRMIAIDGRETAPARATRTMYVGKPDASTLGPLAAGVPGALAAYDLAQRKYGRLKLRDVVLPAARVAENGFPIDAVLAASLSTHRDEMARFEATRRIFLKANGEPYREGEVLRQKDLARTLKSLASNGPDWFYKGPYATACEQWMEKNGGIMTAGDFRRYRAVERTPVVTTYRNHTIAGFPPPSSGGVHVAQILNMLEPYDLRNMPAADRMHVVAEAMKLAFADRAHWLGDPAFTGVPRGLIDKAYGRDLASRIDLQRATPVERHGTPKSQERFRHTTHICAVDGRGNWVGITATVNTSFGSKVVIPGTGLLLNNEMDDFATAPGVPNAYGLVGSAANEVAPGKRPLSSMSPTVVLRDGKPILVLGAAGGPRIITQVLLTLINVLDLGMPLKDALASPRWHHQWSPDRLSVEASMPADLIRDMQRRGHQVEVSDSSGVTQAIGLDRSGFVPLHDPRVPGSAARY